MEESFEHLTLYVKNVGWFQGAPGIVLIIKNQCHEEEKKGGGVGALHRGGLKAVA